MYGNTQMAILPMLWICENLESAQSGQTHRILYFDVIFKRILVK